MSDNTETPFNSTSTSNSSSWFNSWLNAAKNKSTEVLEFVKKDLEEFGTAVKNEASNVVSSAGSAVEKTFNLESPDSTVNSVKRSFSSFLGQVNTALNPSPDDEDTEVLIVENSETHQLNNLQRALYELQKTPETYMCDPDPSLKQQYECWLEILDGEQLSDDRIAKHVNSSEVLKKYYAKLVPEILEHQMFWKRYLFKKALLEDELARKEMMEKRELKEKEQGIVEEQQNTDTLKWEHIDFSSSNMELTEEQQIALLEEYEKEQKTRPLCSKKVVSDKQMSASTRTSENLSKADSSASLGGTPSGGSTDDDWEKIGDIEK